MDINPTTASGNTTSGATTSTSATDKLGRDTFLKLLVTKMQNQDPTRPMEDGEFLTQLAQFSSLETLQEINQSLKAVGQLLVDKYSASSTSTGGQQ